MKFRGLPNGNGKEIYFDPEWLEKEYDRNVFYEPDHDKFLVQEFVKYLEDNGYIVTSDSSTVTDDAFFFNPCLDKHVNKEKDDYSSRKNKIINGCLESGNVKKPFTIPFTEGIPGVSYLDMPFVIKNNESQGGKDKYLIRNAVQLEIFKEFYYAINDYNKIVMQQEARCLRNLSEDVVWDDLGNSKQTGWCIYFRDFVKDMKENFVIQKYIKTPTEYNTSLRVITASSGDVMCASLKYGKGISIECNEISDTYESYLTNPKSPFYLGCESIISNTVSGGDSILLGKDSYNSLEKKILLAHGIDDNNPYPIDVVEAASNIAISAKRQIGAISGMDFIFDEDEQTWYYLEQHEYPMLNTYAEAFGIEYTSVEDYMNFSRIHNIVEMDARIQALVLTIENKKSIKNRQRVK